MTRAPALAAALVLAAASARAAATTGALVLTRPLSARAAALGGALDADPAGLDALGANPAGLASAARPELLSSFTSGVIDDAFGFLGYAHPFKAGVAAAGVSYYDAGKVNLVDAAGNANTVSAERDFVGHFAWATNLGAGVSVGAAAKAYKLTLAQSASASGFAGDAGARWKTPVTGLSLGGSVQNAGPAVKFEQESDPLPTTLRGGAEWTVESRPENPAESYYSATRGTLSADALKVRDRRVAAVGAGEFAVDFGASTSIALRLSWTFNSDADGLALGLGVREGRFVADYASVAKRDLGNIQEVSLGVRF